MAPTPTVTKAGRVRKRREPAVVRPEEGLTLGEYLAREEGFEPEPDTYARTNIMLNERLLAEARELTGLETKREIVEAALKMLVRIKHQEGIRELQGIGWEGDLAEIRRGRNFVIND